MDASPVVLAWEAFRKVMLIMGFIEASKVLMVRSWPSVKDAIGSTPGTSPPRLGGRTGRDEHGACSSKGQATPPSRVGRDASDRKTALVIFFSLLQMGANNSSLTPLNCILKNWDRFDSQGLKKTHLVFLCDTAWLQYPLEG